MEENNIIIFDGVCNLCNASVRFIIARDAQGVFKFTSAQSECGQKLLREYDYSSENLESVILLKDGKLLEKSAAALKIAAALNGTWKYLVILRFIPLPIRDTIYDWIARNRYRWFGKRDICMVPSETQKTRFL